MGRKSRKKKQRREEGDGPLAEVVSAFSTESLTALIDAASVSPKGAHRGLSLALLFEAVVKRRRLGHEVAPAEALAAPMDAVGTIVPELARLEDFQPYDGRGKVLVRWGSDVFRLLPGPLERPIAMVNQHALLAAALDDVLVPQLGFGLADVGEVILRRIDQVARTLALVWPDGPAAH
jgi:hypothetical protein